MIQIVYRVILAAVWLVVGLGMLFYPHLLPQPMVAGRDAVILNIMGLVALLLVAYNVMRLVGYLRRRAARARLEANPLAQPRPQPPREREYIPELDFTSKPEEGRTDEPRPPGSGVRSPEGTTGNTQG